MKRLVALLALVAAALAMLALSNGCIFGSDGDPMTLEDYFADLDKADQDVSDRFDEVTQSLGSSPDLAQVQQEYPGVLDAIDTFLQFIEDLKPPTDVEDVHNDLVDALATYRDEFSNANDSIQSASSLEEAGQAFGEEYGAATQAFDEACLAVQAVADDAQIDVTLGCAEGQEGGGAEATPTTTP
jgi:hypothetical protein